MTKGKEHFERFKRLPLWQQSLVVTAVAVLGADALTLGFYSLFFADRLVLDLVLTAIITVIVAFPIAWLFLGQSAKVSRLADELREASQTDHLTRLANRREFMVSVGAMLAESQSPDGAGVLLFIDADHFKQINDTYGHGVGDEVLIALGSVIRDSVRHADVAARIGGEEFAVFLHKADPAVAQTVAERIRTHTHHISRTMDLEEVGVTVSIGIARHRKGQGLEDVLRAADRSLYVAKKNGRDRIVQDVFLTSAA
jgi:diguanylate cyclase (GGDEF)-like protein